MDILMVKRGRRWARLLSRLSCAALVTVAAALVGLTARAGEAEDRPVDAGFPVAVLRLDKVFKDNPKVNERLGPLKAKAVELQEKVQVRQSEVENTQIRLQRTPRGTNEFEKLQLQLVRLQTELQLFANREKQELELQEAKLYMDLYREVEEVVGEYCKQRGIKMVLRDQDSLDDAQRDNRQEILKTLNRGIIFQDQLDITADISKALAERQAGAAKAGE